MRTCALSEVQQTHIALLLLVTYLPEKSIPDILFISLFVSGVSRQLVGLVTMCYGLLVVATHRQSIQCSLVVYLCILRVRRSYFREAWTGRGFLLPPILPTARQQWRPTTTLLPILVWATLLTNVYFTFFLPLVPTKLLRGWAQRVHPLPINLGRNIIPCRRSVVPKLGNCL